MLPYYLRKPLYGSREKNLQRKRDVDGGGGGPIEAAITNDLMNLREQFRKKIHAYCHTVEKCDSHCQHSLMSGDASFHWKPGTAFGIFKDIFRSSRMAMMHHLPPARCDREAYSQLIYSACLALFKKSFEQISWQTLNDKDFLFNDEKDNEEEKGSDRDAVVATRYNDAVFAIFSLFSLFETNPLPRKIDDENPLELLPVSLRSSVDDPRGSYRRCFSQNIRIDRHHFAMLLQLKEISLAKKCDCERKMHEFIVNLRRRQDNSGVKDHIQNLSLIRRCGISSDAIDIIERILLRLELCEYTGPIGVEAFAGHMDYPYNNQLEEGMSKNEGKDIIAKGEEKYSIESSPELSEELESLMGIYETSINAIRIPISKSNNVKRVQNILEPIFVSNERRDIVNRSSPIIDQNHSYLHHWRQFDVSNEAKAIHLHTNNFGNTNKTKASKHVEKNEQTNYKITLPADLDDSMKSHLRASLIFLLKRDKPIPIKHFPSSKNSLAIDDNSSIRNDSASMGTNHGQLAIEDLLSTVKGKELSRKSRSRKLVINEGNNADNNLVNLFLISNQSVDSVASSNNDGVSVDSDLSNQSFHDEDGVDDDLSVVSAATSTFGTKALEDLLHAVVEEENGITPTIRRKKVGRENTTPKKKRYDHKKDDEASVSSIAAGKKALEDLLHTVAQREKRFYEQISVVRTNNKINTKDAKKRKKKKTKNIVEDKSSIAAKCLLETNNIPSKRNKRSRSKSKISDDDDVDSISVATSACGKRALEALLQKVKS